MTVLSRRLRFVVHHRGSDTSHTEEHTRPRRCRDLLSSKTGRRRLAERIAAQDRMVEETDRGLFPDIEIQERKLPKWRGVREKKAQVRIPLIGRFRNSRIKSGSDGVS